MDAPILLRLAVRRNDNWAYVYLCQSCMDDVPRNRIDTERHLIVEHGFNFIEAQLAVTESWIKE